MPKWKKSKNKTILGLHCETLKGGEIRLKNNYAEIFEYSPGVYRLILTHRPLAHSLFKIAKLISGWTEKPVPSDEYLFEFTEYQSDMVLRICKFLSPAIDKLHLETPKSTQIGGVLP